MLERFVESLAKEFEIDHLRSETPGSYLLPLGAETTVTLSSIGSGFSFSALFGKEAPDEKEEAFLENALLANFMGQGTEGATLGIDPQVNRLTLSRYVDYTINYKEFREALEDFINALDYWQDQVRK